MCSLSELVVAVEWPLLIADALAAGSFLANAALSLIAHNLYLGVLIFQQPDSTFRKSFLSGQLCLQPLQQTAWGIMII